VSTPAPQAVTIQLAALCRARADRRFGPEAIALGHLAQCLDREPIIDDELTERLQSIGARMLDGSFPDESFWQRAESGALADCWRVIRRGGLA
jgi:hypothetical protein